MSAALRRRLLAGLVVLPVLAGVAVSSSAPAAARTPAADPAATRAVAAPAAGPASAAPDRRRAPVDVRVASYNLYLGADLTPLFGATSIPDLVARAGAVYAAMERTNYPERSRTIARLLDRERPDVIGLQEVALWETAPLGSSSWTTTYDFLQLTLDALAARGAHYRVAAVNTNFTNANLPFPIPISATTQARFTDRDVILVRVGRPWRPVVATNPVSRNFAVSLPLSILGQTISVQRGWSSVDVRIRDARFRFVNTHLEAFDGPDGPVKVAQATELAAALRASPLPLVVVGDVNSRPDTPGCNNINTRAYAIIAAVGLREVWPAVHRRNPCGGWTSGQDDTLLNPVSTLTHRIDVIFFDPRFFVARHTEVLGERQRDRTRPSGFWPSDHAGVSATLRWLRHRH